MNDDDTELRMGVNEFLDGGIYVILLVGNGSSIGRQRDKSWA